MAGVPGSGPGGRGAVQDLIANSGFGKLLLELGHRQGNGCCRTEAGAGIDISQGLGGAIGVACAWGAAGVARAWGAAGVACAWGAIGVARTSGSPPCPSPSDKKLCDAANMNSMCHKITVKISSYLSLTPHPFKLLLVEIGWLQQPLQSPKTV